MKASPIIEPLNPSIIKALESSDEDVSTTSYNFLLAAIKSKKPLELINLICLNEKTEPIKMSSVRLRLIKDIIMWYSPSALRTHRFRLEATLISGMHSPKEIQRAAREALILYMRNFS
ncbi:hypothetical protein DSO57_1021907 [Entomophthora muscae]|uniref:Uncharacterized protein n=1 Tax=Entomophthora muscae TaxID=34485 RepID=A0ACC2U2B7_9FUNG|nr:hypothetical protein DSO57_1021907 [Entomophthora muscae]